MGNRRAKDIIKKLKENGFIFISPKGSHKKFKKDELCIIVPDHGGVDLKTGLLKSIERQTGIKLLD